MFRLFPAFLLFIAVVVGLSYVSAAQEQDVPCRIVYVPTEEEVVDRMLDLAEVDKELMEVVRSVDKLIDIANRNRVGRKLPHLTLQDLFSGKAEWASPQKRKEMEDLLQKANKLLDQVNAENAQPLPPATLPDLLEGKSEWATPRIAKLLQELRKKVDLVYDLGCGDGRIVCRAARFYGARGVGIDIDPERIEDCRKTMKKYGLTDKEVEFRRGDALKVADLAKADVVFLYMLPEFMEKLEPQVKKLRPGTRIVAHDYPFPNLKPTRIVEVRGPSREHTLYLWVVGEKGKK